MLPPAKAATLIVVFILAGCSKSTAIAALPRRGPTIVTDSVAYGLRDTAGHLLVTVGTTITNHSGSTVYFDTFCNGILGKQVRENWRLAFTLICRLGSDTSALVPIVSGGSYRHAYRVWATNTGGNPRFEVEPIPGTYRLVYRIYSGAEGDRSQLLPEEERASNRFTLRE